MTLTITPLYASLLVILFLVLSFRIIIYRRRNQIAYGDNDHKRFTAMIRAQGNFTEYAPIGLILILVAELQGINAVTLHILAATLTVGRFSHGLGLAFQPRQFFWRVCGMVLTTSALAALAVVCLWSLT